MRLEITYYQDIFKEDPKNPEEPILVKKNARFKNDINTEDIKVVSWYYNKRGQRVKSKCQIFHPDLGAVVVNVPYDTMREHMLNKPIKIRGFK